MHYKRGFGSRLRIIVLKEYKPSYYLLSYIPYFIAASTSFIVVPYSLTLVK
jgi:hypothetical protein